MGNQIKKFQLSGTLVRGVSRVIVSLMFLELLLRIGGSILIWQQEIGNTQGLVENQKNQKNYKIVCIGDSMTFEGGKYSYPRQLEDILNSRGLKNHFEVINKGLPAQSSGTILPHMISWLDEHQPDMVLVMIGMNDLRQRAGVSNNLKSSPVIRFLNKSYAYRLLQQQVQSLVNSISKILVLKHHFLNFNKENMTDVPSPKVYDPRVILYFKIAEQLNLNGRYDEAEKILLEILKSDVEEANKYLIEFELSKSLFAQQKIVALSKIFEHVIAVDPYEEHVMQWGQQLCGQKELAVDVGKTVKKVNDHLGGVPSLDMLLAACYTTQGNILKANSYQASSQTRGIQRSGPALYKNFNLILDMLNARKIKAVFVQYPLEDVGVLQEIFKQRPDYHSIIFVDNESTFKHAIAQGSYEEYFEDKAVSVFGHGTPKGNKLIAENIFAAIVGHLK